MRWRVSVCALVCALACVSVCASVRPRPFNLLPAAW